MKILKYLLALIFFIYAVILFAPKASLYYLAEAFLAKENIYFSDEKIVQKPFELTLREIKVLFEEVAIGNIKEIDTKLYLVYNKFSVKDAKLVSNSFKLIPKKLDSLDMIYSLKEPLHVKVHSLSDLGEINGAYDIKTQVLKINLKPKKRAKVKYRDILKEFKSNKGGVYSYEKVIRIY